MPTIFFLLILVILLMIFLYSWYRLRKSLNAANDQNKDTPKKYNLKYEIKHFTTSDGVKLKGWYIPVKNAKSVVISVHGYVQTKSTIIDHAVYFHKGGYSTFFIDLRSDYKNTKYTLGVNEWRDIEAAYEYMKSLPENKNKKIGYSSGSMGAATTILTMGKTGKGDFVIASVPYANFKNLFSFQLKAQKLPLFLLPFLRLAALIELGIHYEKYSPDRHISKIIKPVFLMAATYDDMINPEDPKHLLGLANNPKYFWQADTKHLIFKEQREEWEKRVLSFLDKVIQYP